ncbi:unnamed protein product [Bursaphelenchus xylophilus]|uniref:(pine wood nematode) hypothetical protein n=1 Tax=Bursaphelenchus xylophilus TaxID=6326 RepID=A0A1I7SQR3_BURXY|nr:unnamed protein product [Bursaphelenchus xylophilus]CAG9110272.1 unnamed protein product [Bursaphelenchus xylophilus]
MKSLFLFLFLISRPLGSDGQSHSCTFVDENKGYAISWSVGIGFVDFVMSQKDFPARSAHWTGVGFGNRTIQLALIESQYGRVSVSSAGLYGAQPPLKIPTANMVTRGTGSIVNNELRVTFSIPVYYFRGCTTWWFFTSPTQVGMPYSDTPEKRLVCNVNEVCQTSTTATRGKRQSTFDLNSLLNTPINANIDFTGGVNQNTDGQFNVNYNPYNSQTTGYNGQSNYQNAAYNPPNNYQTSGYNGQNLYNSPYQVPSNCMGANCNSQSAFTSSTSSQNFFDTRNPDANSFNGSNLRVDNPNYKFLPDGYNRQFEQNSGRQQFYDQNSNGFGVATTTQQPVLSNDEQNKLNYQGIQSSSRTTNGQRFTNNIYGYDYRSNPGTRYTINGDESMYQPPEVNSLNGRRRRQVGLDDNKKIGDKDTSDVINDDQIPIGRRKKSIFNEQSNAKQNNVILEASSNSYSVESRRKRQSAYAGTAYNNQDLKFPREENTIPMSPQFDALSAGGFNGDNSGFQTANTNSNSNGAMYYPYRTTTNSNFGQNTNNNLNGLQFDQSSSNFNRGTTSNSNFGTSNSNLNGRQFDQSAYNSNLNSNFGRNSNNVKEFYDTNNGVTSVTFRDSTNGNNVRLYDPKNDPTVTFTDNTGFETKPIEVIRQYDDPNCSGADPYWCRDYVKKYMQGAGGNNNLGTTQCAALRQSLLHSDHHCCQTVRQAGC